MTKQQHERASQIISELNTLRDHKKHIENMINHKDDSFPVRLKVSRYNWSDAPLSDIFLPIRIDMIVDFYLSRVDAEIAKLHAEYDAL